MANPPVRLVGDGRTSDNLWGASFLASVFQIPDPQGNDVDPEGTRPVAVADDVDVWAPHAPVSVDGVVGWDAVGDIVLLAKEPLRGCVKGWVVSFSQEARRTGLWGVAAGMVCSWRCWLSPSSSELARASESGVDRLPLSLSSNVEGLLADIVVGYDGWLDLPTGRVFAPEFMSY